jgi:hypothetical protein
MDSNFQYASAVNLVVAFVAPCCLGRGGAPFLPIDSRAPP